MTGELEKERSKVHSLKSELDKVKGHVSIYKHDKPRYAALEASTLTEVVGLNADIRTKS